MSAAAVGVAGAGRSRRRRVVAWVLTLTATAASAGALDATATAAGILLAASGALAGAGTAALATLLAASYVVWGLGMRANVRANRDLLRDTGASTCALSKAAFDLTARRTTDVRARRIAADAGYVAWNLGLDVPYWVAAFGAAAVSDTIGPAAALGFLTGANLGAGLYEFGVARLTTAFLGRRRAAAAQT